MSLTTLAVTYVLGGLTFVPLLLSLLVVPAWLLLPRLEPDVGTEEERKDVLDDVRKGSEKSHELEQDQKYTGDGAASATFAVLRAYNFQAAVAALNARSGVGNLGGASGAGDGNGDAGGINSESVYQSMYRSVFDRRKDGNMGTSVLEDAEAIPAGGVTRIKRKPVGASVFYIVLRHGHLMLYDSPAQVDVRHVVSLAHHSISLSSGDDPVGFEEGGLPEADLFIKRTAIVLTPNELPNGHHQPQAVPPKPFYLFCSTSSEKEDFYHALLYTRPAPPVSRPLRAENIIKLQSTLHSTSLTPETRAFNALVGRIFLAVHRTPVLEMLVRNKIIQKIARVQKPAFIAALTVKAINLGDAAPTLSNPRLKDINIDGDMTLSFDVRYSGGLQVVISALAKLDLGQRFKTRTVDLVLSTSLQRLQGHMLVRVKPPPSNRIWFCFENMPDMEVKVEPVVSQRQITYAFILRAIEERIRAVVGETLVKPNWDDVPFFDTRAQRVRGGIWLSEGADTESDDTRQVSRDAVGDSMAMAAEGFGVRSEKTMSMPTLASTLAADAESSAASSGSDTAPTATATTSALRKQSASLKQRSTASLPLDPGHDAASRSTDYSILPPPKPLRSPSFASNFPAAPSVAVDDANGLPVRADDANLQPKKWHTRATTQNQTRKEAVDAVREVRDRTTPIRPSATAAKDEPASLNVNSEWLDASGYDVHDRGHLAPPPDALPRRTNSASSSQSAQSTAACQQQRKNLLAATAAATNAARNWSWNQIAKRSGQGGNNTPLRQPAFSGSPSSHQTSEQIGQQPIGRGQPLPPPGTPLPGPPSVGAKSLWSAAAGLGGSVGRGSLRRKPALPARRPTGLQGRGGSEAGSLPVGTAEETGQASPETSGTSRDGVQGRSVKETDEEFGPWSENSGGVVADESGTTTPSREADFMDVGDTGTPGLETEGGDIVAEAKPEAKVPPPLPARRRQNRTAQLAAKTPSPGGVTEGERVHGNYLPASVEEDDGALRRHSDAPPADLHLPQQPMIDESVEADTEQRQHLDQESEEIVQSGDVKPPTIDRREEVLVSRE